jgi:hypothetical protein
MLKIFKFLGSEIEKIIIVKSQSSSRLGRIVLEKSFVEKEAVVRLR